MKKFCNRLLTIFMILIFAGISLTGELVVSKLANRFLGKNTRTTTSISHGGASQGGTQFYGDVIVHTWVVFDYTIEGITAENASKDASQAERSAAIYVGSNTTFTMTNGSITGSHNTYGGAVYVESGATFTFDGGTITNCSADYGGAIYVESGATCNIVSGTISNNTATQLGNAIYAEDGAILNITSGVVDSSDIYQSQASGGFFWEMYGTYTVTGFNSVSEISSPYPEEEFRNLVLSSDNSSIWGVKRDHSGWLPDSIKNCTEEGVSLLDEYYDMLLDIENNLSSNTYLNVTVCVLEISWDWWGCDNLGNDAYMWVFEVPECFDDDGDYPIVNCAIAVPFVNYTSGWGWTTPFEIDYDGDDEYIGYSQYLSRDDLEDDDTVNEFYFLMVEFSYKEAE